MEQGFRFGLVPEGAFHVERERWSRRQGAREAVERSRLTPSAATRRRVRATAGVELSGPTSWAAILRRQDVDAEHVAGGLPEFGGLDPEDRRIVIGLLRYDGYLARQERERARLRRLRNIPIPHDLYAAAVPGLSREIAETLARERPRTLADAEGLPGMTPAALAILAGKVGRGSGAD
jgi:tRNA uridine 5-carboxymethylaminomethyl modification enzyme